MAEPEQMTAAELLVAERDALRADLADAFAEIRELGDRVWRLERDLQRFNPKQLSLGAEGMRGGEVNEGQQIEEAGKWRG